MNGFPGRARECAEAIRFDEGDGAWDELPDAVPLVLAEWLDAVATAFEAHGFTDDGSESMPFAAALVEAYLGDG